MFIEVADFRSFKVGDNVVIGSGNQKETNTITAITRKANRQRRARE
jgi:hypothetical protein